MNIIRTSLVILLVILSALAFVTYSRKKRIVFKFIIVLLAPLLLSFGIIFYHDYRLLRGYCDKTIPYSLEEIKNDGKILTAEERLNIAIDDYLDRQNSDIHEVFKKEGIAYMGDKDAKEKITLIRYRNREEFKAENPFCCELTSDLPEGEKVDWKNGLGKDYFRFNHKIRYVDMNGINKTISTSDFFYAVNNCGYRRSFIYR